MTRYEFNKLHSVLSSILEAPPKRSILSPMSSMVASMVPRTVLPTCSLSNFLVQDAVQAEVFCSYSLGIYDNVYTFDA
jgi:hypothetical protein